MHLLLVEDNPRISSSVAQGLREMGYEVTAVNNGGNALTFFRNRHPDLIVLDLGLPDMDGLDILREVRKENDTLPVIILTARDTVDERVAGLDAGADDYLVKPFAFPELAARIRAIERRGSKPTDSTITIADLVIDPIKRHVHRDCREVELTPREFDILHFMAARSGETVPREMLAREVLGIATSTVAYDNIIDVHISNLRKKIDVEAPAKLLHTLRGVGYTLEDRS
jgi:DNA-binding response OmpR family regulator